MTTTQRPALDSFDNVTVINGRTDREWEELARQYEANSASAYKEAHDSFECSDTDGFLSQWASDCIGNLHRQKASWARAHGMHHVRALFDLDGNVISTMERENQHGTFWVLNDAGTEKIGKRFISDSEASTDDRRIKNNAKKGISLGRVTVRGTWELRGANHLSVRPCFVPDVGALKIGNYTVAETTSRFDRES